MKKLALGAISGWLLIVTDSYANDFPKVPLPFECVCAKRVPDMAFVEKQVHNAFDDVRVRSNREFFEIDPQRVVAVLAITAGEDVTPTEAIAETAEDVAALNKAKVKRSSLDMEALGVEVGAILTFKKDPSITCQVVNGNKVEFEGEVTSLTASALKVINERMGYDWTKIAGPSYWLYHGMPLSDLRNEMEAND